MSSEIKNKLFSSQLNTQYSHLSFPGLLYQRRLTIFNEMFYIMLLRAYFKLNESAAFFMRFRFVPNF